MIASVTELKLKNIWCYFQFLPHAILSKMQADKSPGVISVQVTAKGFLTQRTLTVWKDEASLLQFVKSGAHMKAMRVSQRLSTQTKTARFEVKSLPTWNEALSALKTKGRSHSL